MEASRTLSSPDVELLDCNISEDVNIHNSHCLGWGARRRSLAIVSDLALPYTPSLLEIFQRLCYRAIHPVMYYILARAYSGPLQVIDTVYSTATWYQVANRSSLLKLFPRNPFLTLIDARGAVHSTAEPSRGPLTPMMPPSAFLTPYYPAAPMPSKPVLDREPFGSTALCDVLHTVIRMRLSSPTTATQGYPTISEWSTITSMASTDSNMQNSSRSCPWPMSTAWGAH